MKTKNKKVKANRKKVETRNTNPKQDKVNAQLVQMRFMEQAVPQMPGGASGAGPLIFGMGQRPGLRIFGPSPAGQFFSPMLFPALPQFPQSVFNPRTGLGIPSSGAFQAQPLTPPLSPFQLGAPGLTVPGLSQLFMGMEPPARGFNF